jgi:hypothetical protein
MIKQLQERDAMVCRSCGNEERASEGYPCVDCGTFICQMCDMRGVSRCKNCQAKRAESRAATGAEPPAAQPPG